jgi:hypothetical protein
MKLTQVGEFMVANGVCALIGEYRGFLADKVSFVDKKDGRAKSFVSVYHLIEVGDGGKVQQIRLTERVPPEVTEPAQVKPTMEKGKTYVFPLHGLSMDQGRLEGRLANIQPKEVIQ